MKRISYWALLNPVKSRLLIAAFQITLTVLAVHSGIWLFARGVELPVYTYYTGLGLFFTALIGYPIRHARHSWWKMTFVKQKTMDSLLLAGYLLLTVSVANTDAFAAWREPAAAPRWQTVSLESADAARYNVAPEKSSKRYKMLKKTLRQRYKQYVAEQRAKNSAPADQGLVIFLVVLAMAALIAGILMLACSLACSGANGLALLVAIGGSALVLIGGILLIRRITGKRRNRYEPMPGQ